MKDANIQGHQPCPAASSVQKMLRHDKQGSQSNPNTIAIHCTCTQGLCTINNGETKAKDTPMTSVRAASMCQWKKNGFSFPSCDPNIDMAHISHHAFTNGHQSTHYPGKELKMKKSLPKCVLFHAFHFHFVSIFFLFLNNPRRRLIC